MRIGVALSDPGGMLASPFAIIERRDEDTVIETIVNTVNQQKVNRIIVGLPQSMSGSIGAQAEKVIAFVHKLREHTEITIEFRDERLTTVSVKRMMQSVSRRKSKQKTRHDAMAAALILQSYLDEEYKPDS